MLYTPEQLKQAAKSLSKYFLIGYFVFNKKDEAALKKINIPGVDIQKILDADPKEVAEFWKAVTARDFKELNKVDAIKKIHDFHDKEYYIRCAIISIIKDLVALHKTQKDFISTLTLLKNEERNFLLQNVEKLKKWTDKKYEELFVESQQVWVEQAKKILDILALPGLMGKESNEDGYVQTSPLFTAVWNKNYTYLVCGLIHAGADIDYIHARKGSWEYEGYTGLMYADKTNDEANFEILLEAGANINVFDRNAESVIAYAFRQADMDRFFRLRDLGGKISLEEMYKIMDECNKDVQIYTHLQNDNPGIDRVRGDIRDQRLIIQRVKKEQAQAQNNMSILKQDVVQLKETVETLKRHIACLKQAPANNNNNSNNNNNNADDDNCDDKTKRQKIVGGMWKTA